MIERHHQKGDAASWAVYSPCETYRYALTRVWDAAAPRVMFLMLNPSRATEVQNDPTIERCERRARMLGYGAFRVTNLFAYRATIPADMRAATDAIGPENDVTIRDGAVWAGQVICAWGIHGAHLDRGPSVARDLAKAGTPLSVFGLSRAGHPLHPLYLPYSQRPQPWVPGR